MALPAPKLLPEPSSVSRSLGAWARAALPSGDALPRQDWERHHALVIRVLVVLSAAVPLYAAARGYGAAHVIEHAAPLLLLTLVARLTRLSRSWRSAAAVLALMTASALVVHSSNGATEAHFMFFALLPLAAVYAAWPPFLLAIAYVALHHFVLGTLLPGSVFDHPASALGMAGLHAAFIVVECLACLVAWRLFDDRRALVERLVKERTAELSERREELSRLAAIVDSTDEAVFTTTLEGVIETWNPGAERLYGYTPAEAVGQRITLVVAPERLGFFASTLSALGKSGQQVENLHVRKDGSQFEALLTISKIYDEHGTATGAAGIVRDISERKQIEAQAVAVAQKLEAQAGELSRLAMHDPLTGLANRALMQERMELALDPHGSRRIALLLVDLDEFKAVNDVAGHLAGDQVLVEVGRRLTACVRPADTVARLGGDEFVILLEDVEGSAAAAVVAERILTALAEPIEVRDRRVYADASIGITLSGDTPYRGPSELMRDADVAMYEAKTAGKGRLRLFEKDMRDRVVAHTQLVGELRAAVAEGQLRVLYQPQVDLSSGRMTGVEALVRWEHPDQGLMSPDQFIPVAESTGLIVAIDDWVLREACAQMRAWDHAGLPPLQMAVNVSARRLVSGDLADTIAAVIATSKVDPVRLEVEITETVAVQHEAEAVEAINRVRALGVRVALDDFGMGYSALSRLQSFPVDRLKIDRSFVAPLEPGQERGSIVEAMIAIGHSLGLAVLAEGVETQEHVRALRSLGCGSAQGFLFSRPVAPGEIERLAFGEADLVPREQDDDVTEAQLADAASDERQIRSLLAELERLTGLESTYLTRIDWTQELQEITHSRNVGAIDIPEGLTVDWSDTVCRRALEQGISYTDDMPATFPDSDAAAALGLQTYVSVPVTNADGEVEGTLCGASTRRLTLTPEAVKVMERFARLMVRSRDPVEL